MLKTIKVILILFFLIFASCGGGGSSQGTNGGGGGDGVTTYNDSPFGFHPALVTKPGYTNNGYHDAQNIGVGWNRASLYAFWFKVQPDLDTPAYNWEEYDNLYGNIPEGINILANIATQPRGYDAGYEIPGTYLPVDESKYSLFVKATVERYDGDGIDDVSGLTNPIKYWQVNNEPDVTRTGYAELQRITYIAIKEACPDCNVLIGGATGFPEDYIAHFDRFYAPILAELGGQFVDIFDFHWYGTADGEYRLRDTTTGQDVPEHILSTLTANGFSPDLPVWITEMGSYSGDPADLGPKIQPFQTERQQALDYFKRFIYPLSRGVKKVFPAFGLIEGFKHDNGYFDHTGLIYDGNGSDDLGLGVKKLSYYTYKLMTEKLEGSDWDNTRTIRESDNVYVYKFTPNPNKFDTGQAKNGNPVYVAWWDYFDDTGSSKTVTLNVGNIDSVKVTEAVPNADSGAGLNENDYPNFFETETKSVTNGQVTLTLGDSPVFIEVKQ
ncbi:hypothetical protein BMS3Bbin06_00719 [bacterium BMS3Bbin06]|nr:hypothetical protein BMS3Bbin06_00719 [bacterium BMS3Bbin06]